MVKDNSVGNYVIQKSNTWRSICHFEVLTTRDTTFHQKIVTSCATTVNQKRIKDIKSLLCIVVVYKNSKKGDVGKAS